MPGSTKEGPQDVAQPARRSSIAKSLDSKDVENTQIENGNPGPDQWLERYPLLKDKTPEELKAIDKSLLRKLDWKFLPFVSLMLIMK